MDQQQAQESQLPPLESIVQKMIDAGEPEKNIAKVVQFYHPTPTKSNVPPTKLEGEPTSFWGGVAKSFATGEAQKAGVEGGMGWLKGATLDLPSSIIGGIKNIGNLITDPVGTVKAIPGAVSDMWDTAKQAGSNPSAFGEMMGQIGGQPMVTAGLGEVAPLARNPVGSGLETIGKVMQEHKPITGLVPFSRTMPTLGKIEGLAGSGIQNIGEAIKSTKKVNGKIVEPNFTEGQIIPDNPNELPPSNTKAYANSPNRTPLPPKSDVIDPRSPTSGKNMNSPITNSVQPPAPKLLPSKSSAPITDPSQILKASPMFDKNALEDMYQNHYKDFFGSSGASASDIPYTKSGSGPSLEILNPDESTSTNNGSGESAASAEAINRDSSMKNNGQQFVVYDKMGNKRPLIGPDAVDYKVGKGESYGIQGPNGEFTLLDDNGGMTPDKFNRTTMEPSSIFIKTLDPAVIKKVLQKGYKFDSIREDGAYKMVKPRGN